MPSWRPSLESGFLLFVPPFECVVALKLPKSRPEDPLPPRLISETLTVGAVSDFRLHYCTGGSVLYSSTRVTKQVEELSSNR